MKAAGSLLAQVAPAITPTQTTIFTASVPTEITAIFICNTSGAATFRLHHDVNGTTFAVGNALYYDTALGANTTKELFAQTDSGGIMMGIGDSLGIEPSTADLVVTVYGVTFTAAGPTQAVVPSR